MPDKKKGLQYGLIILNKKNVLWPNKREEQFILTGKLGDGLMEELLLALKNNWDCN